MHGIFTRKANKFYLMLSLWSFEKWFYGSLCWGGVTVNFMCPLNWIARCPDIWLHITLSMSVRVFVRFQKRSALKSVDWGKQIDCPAPCGCIIYSLEGLNRTKMWRKGGFTGSLPDCLSLNINLLLPLVLPALRPSDLDWDLHYQPSSFQAFKLEHCLSWVFSLQSRSRDFSAFIITEPD